MWLIQMAINRASARGKPLPPFELILNPTDKSSEFGTGGTQKVLADPLPLFCNAKCSGDASISFPIMFNAQFGGAAGEMSLPLYYHKYNALLAADSKQSWEDKKPKLFFTSTNTRGNRAAIFKATSPAILALPRVVPMSDYTQYQYLLYAYGHNGWSQRLRELCLMKAVVVMEESRCHEYYQDVLQPGVDHVTVQEDFANLDTVADEIVHSHTANKMASAWLKRGKEVSSIKRGAGDARITRVHCL
jgi:hypothetical protein